MDKHSAQKELPETMKVKRISKPYTFVKRLADILLSVVGIVVLIVPMLVVAVLIKICDGGNVLYIAPRLGKNGKFFNMYKFKTMQDSNKNKALTLTEEEYELYKKEFKLENDKRVTKLGYVLRKSSIDEVPQLFNVLKGEMSLVGPRPIVKDEILMYGEDAEKFLSIKPGLTGYWQAYARNDVGYSNGERQKMELYYVDNCSCRFDIKILFATIKRVVSGRGAS